MKIDETTINDAEDLVLVVLMYNLTGYSPNYCETIGSLWFYFKDEATNFHSDTFNDKVLNLLDISLNY